MERWLMCSVNTDGEMSLKLLRLVGSLKCIICHQWKFGATVNVSKGGTWVRTQIPGFFCSSPSERPAAVLYNWVSIPAGGTDEPFFYAVYFYIYAVIQDICFLFLIYFTLYNRL